MNGDVQYMNKVAEQSTGWKLEDARGKPVLTVFRVIDERSQEIAPDPVALCLNHGKSNMLTGHLLLTHRYRDQQLSVEVNASPIRDTSARITGVVLVFHDVTELRGLTRKMHYQATHDPLTGLINRREFESRINQALEITRTENIRHVLCFLDLDNFKIVNDTSGHIAGDELLKQLTIKLRMELREADTLARLGGDEFGIMLEGCSVENALEPAETIRKIVDDFRFVWDNTSFRVGASIGLVPVTEESGTLTDLMSAADSACYVAKEQGRNRIHIYRPNDETLAARNGQVHWMQRIQDALEQDRFRLFFQPFVELASDTERTGKIHGEILVRVLDEGNKIVSPGSFMPSAERYLLMPEIDRWVVSNTFRMLTVGKEHARNRIDTCCINLSGQSMSDEDFISFLVNEIRESGIDPGQICFEITEKAVIANLSVTSRLITTLRNMGCRFALDDFGVGLGSFNYLKNMAIDYLKLDGGFVKNMAADNIDHAMVKAINQIGHTMNIKTIAEFVEDHETLEVVRSIGVDYAQGYLIAKPEPLEFALFSEAGDIDEIGGNPDAPSSDSTKKHQTHP
jgi:diguanylate cyclase (GGDEF)-like protein/PAS domain S-box-containing protein